MATINRTIIIGAGVSGLMAANTLVSLGKKVILLEKKHQAGLKLRITGKGRCNLTNDAAREEYFTHISNPEFFAPAFDNFNNKALCEFFEQRSVALKTERGNRIYPKSDKALDIFLALLKPLEDNPLIDIRKNCYATKLLVRGGRIEGVDTNLGRIMADNVIIATGGCTYPSTGSEGDGYDLAEQAGHRIIEPIPALVGLRTSEGYPRELQGFEIKNCEVKVTNKNKDLLCQMFGDIYLDEYG
ncbi:MAG: aminoacetone oxidase family FAD-binding enzyme, partial [Bacteroidales bacterium]|nr:aminoacetone oxidase family FAD-binding enzyme [Bacteroidales bacterium]